ncbi:MAG TPA: helix-hairpin-helix domain-containing protein [Chitinophagaceae bacterium]|nr:helix-hairpin-helix domain-containing protein [Chitinophagaceae bacterium]
MSWKKTLRSFLTFSHKDRIGLLCLCGLIFVVFRLPAWFPAEPPPPPQPVTALRQLADSLLVPSGRPDSHPEMGPVNRKGQNAGFAPPSGPFDPNTLNGAGWEALGLRSKTVRTILNYRSKGGRFRRPEDLQKIWGLPPGFYERVVPYIRIQNSIPDAPASSAVRTTYPRAPEPRIVSLNEADSAALEALPGIGPRLAARLLQFRSRLGGFYAVDQVAETYGLPDSTFQRIRPLLTVNSSAIRKIRINQATEEELKAHPYIRWQLARVLVAYRAQHGPFRKPEDLLNCAAVSPELLRKLVPYLEWE